MKLIITFLSLLFFISGFSQNKTVYPEHCNFYHMPTGDTLFSVQTHGPGTPDRKMKIHIGCANDSCNYNYFVYYKDGNPVAYTKYESNAYGENLEIVYYIQEGKTYKNACGWTDNDIQQDAHATHIWAVKFNAYMDRISSEDRVILTTNKREDIDE